MVFLGDVTKYEYLTKVIPSLSRRIVSDMNYAQGCYRNDTPMQNCPTFLRKSLPWTSKRNLECPFPGRDKICRSNSTNLRLDTGYLNSNHDLGINLPPKDQFLYRTLIECAPLKTEGYSRNVTIYFDGNVNRPIHVMRYYYGELGSGSPDTYQYSADPPFGLPTDQTPSVAPSDYSVATQWAYASPNVFVRETTSSFSPIADLYHSTADVVLIFLSANEIVFTDRSDDSWYSAHVPGVWNKSSVRFPGPLFGYLRDDPVRILGCSSQYQFCNPNLEPNSGCTPLTGLYSVQELGQSLWHTEKQKALFAISSNVILNSIGIPEVINQLGISSLTARDKLLGGFQGPLPDNQWELEVENWFTTVLADLQREVVTFASGPMDANLDGFLTRPEAPEDHLMCRNQKIRSDSFTSFSTVGLASLLGIGGLIIGLSYALEPFVEWIQRRRHIGAYKRLEWNTNEVLQLQRLAHEELGFGTWMRTAEEYPVTKQGEQLAILDISDLEHPLLRAPMVNASPDEEVDRKTSTEQIERQSSTAGLSDATSVPDSTSNPP